MSRLGLSSMLKDTIDFLFREAVVRGSLLARLVFRRLSLAVSGSSMLSLIHISEPTRLDVI
eukprot:5948706-Prorocentrum_lima.AAC.1